MLKQYIILVLIDMVLLFFVLRTVYCDNKKNGEWYYGEETFIKMVMLFLLFNLIPFLNLIMLACYPFFFIAFCIMKVFEKLKKRDTSSFFDKIFFCKEKK